MSLIQNNLFRLGKPLYHKVMAGFVEQQTTLTAWCKENGYKQPVAKACLIGTWDGPKARVFRRKLIDAAGVDIQIEDAA